MKTLIIKMSPCDWILVMLGIAIFVHTNNGYRQLVDPKLTEATQSTTYRNYVASLTIDGKLSKLSMNDMSCSHTGSDQKQAWVQLDFKKVYNIKSIKFWYRNDRGNKVINTRRLHGYSLWLYEKEWEECYRDTTPVNLPIPMPSTVECHGKAKHMQFYTETPWDGSDVLLEICEIEVYGCKENQYGENCTDCGRHCLNCHIVKGCIKCQSRFQGKSCENCLPGYTGINCDIPCKPGLYGTNCSLSCSGYCLNRASCSIVDGSCSSGCMPGYIGDTCQESCTFGKYGNHCQKSCSGNCFDNKTCDNVEGICENGCAKGWKGSRCFNECDKDTYGENCKYNCSEHCYSKETCDRLNGDCPSGCDPGWSGSLCKEKCISGMYGPECNGTCDTCNDKLCNHVTGICAKGCIDGWSGALCENECDRGTYGENCMYNCSGNCYSKMTCDRFTGACLSGCDPGWSGSLCKEKCLSGTYGLQCNGTCDTCNDNLCHHVTGICDKGCMDGWAGALCEEVCPDGFFGSNCSQKCGKCEFDTCHHINGSCQGKCKDAFEGDRCQEVTLSESASASSISYVYIATGAGVGTMVVLIIIAVLFIVRCRVHRKFKTSPCGINKAHPLEDEINGYPGFEAQRSTEEMQKTDETEESTYFIIEDTSKSYNDRHIMITDLADTIALKSENNGFQEEYQSISHGEDTDIPCAVGKRPENNPKNRYKTTFPYDHSRVVLKNTKNDYINANFIQNLEGEHVYIASQGPKPKTVADHWLMIWQENVSVIVMLTNLNEGTKKKCAKYWPDIEKDTAFGKIKTQCLQEKQYAYYAVRRLKVTNPESKSSRIVTHFHYTEWPDHGVPDPVSLAIFQKHVRRIQNEHTKNPLLVHCSAGIGRTGTFIALDALYQHGLETGTVNVKEYVKIMRKDRMNMVQNCEQYIVLYKALKESFCSRGFLKSRETFMNDVNELNHREKSTPQWILSEFEELQSIKKAYAEDEKRERKQSELNIRENILPVDMHRTVRTATVQGRNNFCNAVFLSTFTNKDMLITAQYPHSGNSVDLFRLLLDHESSIVVFVNPLTEIPSSSEWFHDKKTTLYPYEIFKERTFLVTPTLRKHEFKVCTVKQRSWRRIHIFEMISWNIDDVLPSDISIISDVIRNVRMEEADRFKRTPITVMSKDGVTGCGVFCSIYNALQQLQQDDEVDMFTIVKQLQTRQAEMISISEEYRFCYQATAKSLSDTSSEVYSNTECVYANI